MKTPTLFLLFSIILIINSVNCEIFKDWLKDSPGIHNGFNVCASVIIGSFIVGTPLFIIVKLVIDHVQKEDKEKKQIQEAQKRINKKNEMVKQQSPSSTISNTTTISPNSTTTSNGAGAGVTGANKKPIAGESYNSTQMLREVIENTLTIDKMFTTTNNNSSSTFSTPSNQSTPIGSSPLKNSIELMPTNINISTTQSPTSASPIQQRKANINTSNNLQSNATVNIHSEVVQSYLIKKECEPQLLVIDGVNQLLLSPPSPVLSTFGKSSISNGVGGNRRHSDISPILEASFFNSNALRRSSRAEDEHEIQHNQQKNKELIDSIDNLMNATLTSSQQYQLRKLSNASSTNYSVSSNTPPIYQQPSSSTNGSGNNTPNRQSIPVINTLNTSNSSNGNNNNSGFRPRSLTMSQNISLLNYLSTNAMPKDNWNCIVQRLLELFTSFLIYTNNQSLHGKYTDSNTTSQATFSALNSVEMAISNFSDCEKTKKRISSINDQRYFSPITFELYNKILPTHEFIKNSKRTNERDITGIIGIFSILIPSLFRSFNKYYDNTLISNDSTLNGNNVGGNNNNNDFLLTIEEKRKFLERSKNNITEFTSISLLSSYQSKKLTHKVSMSNLIEYIKMVIPVSFKNNSFNTIFSIIDQCHGIADEIDKILFQCEEFKKELFEQSSNGSANNNGSNSKRSSVITPSTIPQIPIDHDILDMVKLELLQSKHAQRQQTQQQQQQTQQQQLECSIEINNLSTPPPQPTPVSHTKPFIPPIKVSNNFNNNGSPQVTPRGGIRYSPRLQTLPSPRPSPRLTSLPSPRLQLLQQQSPRLSPRLSPRPQTPIVYEFNKMDDDLKFLDFLNTNNNSINRSICNKFDIIDTKLISNSKSSSSSSSSSSSPSDNDINLQKQKNILLNCYKSLESSLNLFSISDKFTSKCKADSIPIVKLLLSTLQNLQDFVETGISIEQMVTLEFMEWTNNYSKVLTSLNNTLIKNNTPIPTSSSSSTPSSAPTSTNNSNQKVTSPQLIKQQSKNRTLSSPFGPPIECSSNNLTNSNTINNNVNNSPCESPRSLLNLIGDDELSMNNNDCVILRRIKEFKLPNSLERCQQLTDLSQENIMITILSCFSLCFKELNNVQQRNSPPSTPPQNGQPLPQLPLVQDLDKQTFEFFNNSLSIFLSSIRTSIFCTTLLLSPIYYFS